MLKGNPAQFEDDLPDLNKFDSGEGEKIKRLKVEIADCLLDSEGKAIISELEAMSAEDGLLNKALQDFLKKEDYQFKFRKLIDIFRIIDILMDFLELDEIISLTNRFDQGALRKELESNLNRMNKDFLVQLPCNFDVAVELIKKFLGAKYLVLYLDCFKELQEVLALYTRPETLKTIEGALSKGLESKQAVFKKSAQRVINNSGLYFFTLRTKVNNEFQLNKFIKLKLENNNTNIYVKDSLFNQCKFLFINIPKNKLPEAEVIDSIDEAAEKLDRSLEGGGRYKFDITPETEFWGHCSNLQAWIENNYDTRILHRNLAFPLLKRLTEVGDPLAKRVFKAEILKRLESGYPSVVAYLSSQRYLSYFTDEELKIICEDPNSKFISNMMSSLGQGSAFYNMNYYLRNAFVQFQRISPDHFGKRVYEELIKGDIAFYKGVLRGNFLSLIEQKLVKQLIHNPDCVLRELYVSFRGKPMFVNRSLGLKFKNRKIKSISEIKGLHRVKHLVSLDLRKNEITEISGLENLENLKRLYLSDNPISLGLLNSLGGLDKFGKAKKPQRFVEYCKKRSKRIKQAVKINNKEYEVIDDELYLSELGIQSIKEIKGLDKLTSLKVLDLSKNQLMDFKGLENLKNLEILNLQENQIADTSGLEGLESLRKLRLYGNGIYEIKGLDKHPNLKFVALDTRRKLDSRVHLKRLLESITVKEMKEVCSEVKAYGYSRYSRYQLVRLISQDFTKDQVEETLAKIEKQVVSKGLENAIRKIKSARREKLNVARILSPSKQKIEVVVSGHKETFNLKMTINRKTINTPPYKCSCPMQNTLGYCDHFWMAFIFAYKKGFFKLEDWTLTLLPEDLEEKLKSINVKQDAYGNYKYLK